MPICSCGTELTIDNGANNDLFPGAISALEQFSLC